VTEDAGICFIRAAVITPNGVGAKDSGSPDYGHDQNETVGYAGQPGQGENDDCREGRNRRAARSFSDNDGGPADQGDQHLAKEPELAVAHNGSRRENGGEQRRHRYNARGRRIS
jgi:hypothetical protein